MVKRQARSARGVVVDFDLLKIKNQIIQNSPASLQVDARQEYIDKKLRRKVKKVLRKIEETAVNTTTTTEEKSEPEVTNEQEVVQETEGIIKQKTK